MKPLNAVIFFGILTALLVAATAALAEPPEVIVIDKAQAKKAPVTFPHAAHAADIECISCHHTAQTNDAITSCFECHGKDPAAPDPSVSSKKENPFHVSCIGCHKEKAQGPTKCAQCHPRQ
jgi:hypothetical protein